MQDPSNRLTTTGPAPSYDEEVQRWKSWLASPACALLTRGHRNARRFGSAS